MTTGPGGVRGVRRRVRRQGRVGRRGQGRVGLRRRGGVGRRRQGRVGLGRCVVDARAIDAQLRCPTFEPALPAMQDVVGQVGAKFDLVALRAGRALGQSRIADEPVLASPARHGVGHDLGHDPVAAELIHEGQQIGVIGNLDATHIVVRASFHHPSAEFLVNPTHLVGAGAGPEPNEQFAASDLEGSTAAEVDHVDVDCAGGQVRAACGLEPVELGR